MLNSLSTTIKRKKKKILGRGGKHAKTSGRGTKGQKARAGHKMRPQMRDIIKKLPKLRGRGKNVNKAFGPIATIISLENLALAFPNGGRISRKILRQKGLVTDVRDTARVKILGTAALTTAFMVYDCEVSKGAAAAITKAGGSVHAGPAADTK